MNRHASGFVQGRRSALGVANPNTKSSRPRGGFTLVEVLVAVTLTLVMMAAVVQVFAIVGRSINDSRATLEMSDRLRAASNRLRLDLEGVTANMTPPGRPEEGKGYFEYVEGPIGPVDPSIAPPGYNTDEGGEDTTVGDRDDILQFTTRTRNEPFVGRAFRLTSSGPERVTVKSQVAEVAWFLRGTTLYRRVLLVSPSFDADISPTSTDPREAEVPNKNYYISYYNSNQLIGYYHNYDLSVHWDENAKKIACNTLADLTRRECRYAHPPSFGFPFALHSDVNWRPLGLPLLQECSHAAWPFPINGQMPLCKDGTSAVIINKISDAEFDAWVNPYPYIEIDPNSGAINLSSTLPENPEPPNGWPSGTLPPTILFPSEEDSPRYVGGRLARVGEDVILTNVLSFDVKAWDPGAPVLLENNVVQIPGDINYLVTFNKFKTGGTGAPVLASSGAYVDLGYLVSTLYANTSDFSGLPHSKSMLAETNGPRIYDTWSIHYEHDGVNQDNDQPPDGTNRDDSDDPHLTDEGTDGFDNDGDGVVDDPDEREAPPPYSAPLRGIQVKIRVFDPDSRQVREVTVQQDFLNN